ncbi:MAG TPA: dTDP-glucose 4,6-dehydratase [Thermoanaerobaculia bacterium]|jgi:dTDP-glucose 4,6-dehydratase|nr:dTDP-glucose 4,6-dehydratase [Thermoanaerobaculia bacterium]
MDTLLVTGGAGFIGCNFVRLALAETEARVVVLDKLTYAGSLESLDDVLGDPRLRFVRGDVAERPAVQRVFLEHRPAAVVNFAAESHVDRSIDDASDFVRTNVVGAFELLEAARLHLAAAPAAERERFRFLHVSTDEVYGSLGPTGAFSESTPYAPNSPYAASKAGADHLVRAYHETHGLPALLTNCSNNYGPFQFPEKLIPLMILNALEGRPLPLYGDGGNVRDWLYVEDHCRGLLTVLRHGRPGERYNLGGRSERTNLQIVDTLCDILESERPAAANPALAGRSYRDLKTFVADRPGHDRRYAIDDARIRRELGWEPRHDFAAGLRATVRWYLANRAWCEAVQAGRYGRERLGLGISLGRS